MKQRRSRTVKKNGVLSAAQGTSAGRAIKKVLRSSLSPERLLDMFGRQEVKANSKLPLKVNEQTVRSAFKRLIESDQRWREILKIREELRQLLRADRPKSRRRRTKKFKIAWNMPRLPSQLALPSTAKMYLVSVRRCVTSKDGVLLDYGPSRVYFPTWNEIPKKFTAEMAHRFVHRYSDDPEVWNDIPEMATVYNVFHKFWFRKAFFAVEVEDEEDLVENYEEILIHSALEILFHLYDWGPDPWTIGMHGGWTYPTEEVLDWPAVELKLEFFASEEEEAAASKRHREARESCENWLDYHFRKLEIFRNAYAHLFN